MGRVKWMIAIVAAIIFIIFTLGSIINKTDCAGVFAYKLLMVTSESMQPALDAGSLIVVKKTSPERIQPGDIITYQVVDEKGQLITHRVMEVVKEKEGIFFRTKGDANYMGDFALIPADNLIGKVTGKISFSRILVYFYGTC